MSEEGSDPPGLRVQAGVSCPAWMLGSKLESSGRAFSTAESQLQPFVFLRNGFLWGPQDTSASRPGSRAPWLCLDKSVRPFGESFVVHGSTIPPDQRLSLILSSTELWEKDLALIMDFWTSGLSRIIFFFSILAHRETSYFTQPGKHLGKTDTSHYFLTYNEKDFFFLLWAKNMEGKKQCC